jgi:hypothetical protein
MDYIRAAYGVPAKRGGRIQYRGQLGTITGADGGYLRIRLDGEKRSKRFHPTWLIEYLDA